MIRHKPLRLIRASAGSGKTFALTAHYLTLLFSGPGKYREILAVTFTNKATAEMKDRILSALKELALHGYEQSKFASVLLETYPDLTDQEVRTRASAIYSDILHDFSRFSVSTIDKFVQQLIRSFAFELNLDSGYKLEMNQDKVKEALIGALNIRLATDPDLMNWVTQLAIDRINDGKDWDYQRTLKDLAGEIFKERYYPFQEAMMSMGDEQGRHFNDLKEIVESGILQFKEFVLEKSKLIKQLFTDSGVLADELKDKSRNPLLAVDKIIVGDFVRLEKLTGLADDFELWKNKSLKDETGVRSLYERANPEIRQLKEFVEAKAELYETYVAINRNAQYLRLMQGMADLLKNYRSETRSLLSSDAQQLLKGITSADADNPSFIWEKTGNRYKHFLFDEFQDTSTYQWINFLPLVKNAIATSERNMPEHLVVGDVKQSIYRWRNGDWRILHSRVREDLFPDNISEDQLEYNRRSFENIIRFNNYLYAKLPHVLQELLNSIFADSARAYLHEEWEVESSRLIEKAYERSGQEMTESTPKGGMVEIRFFEKGADEDGEDDQPAAMGWMVERLAELLRRGYEMRDIGILVRANREAVEVLDVLLNPINHEILSQSAGKTFQVISGEALRITSNPAVQLLIATCRMLAGHDQEAAVFQVECGRLFREISAPSSEELSVSSSEWLDLSTRPIEELSHILPGRLCTEFNRYRQMPLAELIETLMQVYGLSEISDHFPFLLALRDQVAVFAATGDQGLAAFLEWWDLEGAAKALSSSDDQNAVQVMTVHKSKGLEFGAVILPFINWKLASSPGRNLIWVDAEAAGFAPFNSLPVDYNKGLASTVFAKNYFEEMLLSYMDVINTLYVATTRAKSYLGMICPSLSSTVPRGPESDLQRILVNLLSMLTDRDPAFTNEDGHFVFGELPSLPRVPNKTGDGLLLDKYLVNEDLAQRFRKNTANSDSWFNARQRKGVALHTILERLSDLDHLERLIAELVQDGLIRKAETDEIAEAVHGVMTQREISAWYREAGTIVSERDMILEGGMVRRPDKLFVFDGHAVLLDFKFGEEHPQHLKDIALYRDTLLRMGELTRVDAYLWYAQEKRLVKV